MGSVEILFDVPTYGEMKELGWNHRGELILAAATVIW